MARLARLLGTLVVALAWALALGSPVFSHPATERYIPIGKSPGALQAGTVGVIEEVNVAGRSIRVAGQGEAHWVRLTDRTHVWLDRTSLAKSNLVGGLGDCEVGRTVEIHYEDPESRTVAAWIKVAVPSPAGTAHGVHAP